MRLALFNPAAGSMLTRGLVNRAFARLKEQGVRLVETSATGIAAQTRALLTPDITEVIACGGDGTVSDVAAGIAGTEVTLRIVPCGTTNVLAREFGVPLNPVKAADAVATMTTRRQLHTWTAGDRHLVLGAGVGWDADMMHQASPLLKRWFGFAGLMPQAFGLAVSYRFPRLEISGIGASGESLALIGTSVLISNTQRWSGPNPAITGADPFDDLLDVVILDGSSITNLLTFWMLLTVPGGRPLKMEGVRRIPMRSVRVESRADPMPLIHVNGEPAGSLPLKVTAGPRVWVGV